MKVELLHNTPLWVPARAIRTCWNSHDKSDTYVDLESGDYGSRDGDFIVGEKDRELIDRVGNKFKHASTLEHLAYTFYIQGISRALLQELARHRMASLSVKSTRYTLKELKKEESFHGITKETEDRAKKYLVFTGVEIVDIASIRALENLRQVLKSGVSNDKAKYCLPESYKTELTWTINSRSLQNFLSLRSSKEALWEIRDLAHAVYAALPEDHKYLFTECIKVTK